MEHVLHAARAGRIAKLAVKEGQQVTQGALIAVAGGCVGCHPGVAQRHPGPRIRPVRMALGPGYSLREFRDDSSPPGRSDWMRLTPAFSMLFQAAASEPCVSMPRQASSMT